MSDSPQDIPPAPRRRNAVWRWALRLGFVLTAVLAGLAIGFALLPSDRLLAFPDWARARIEARMDRLMPGGEVRLGEIGIGRTGDSRRPRIILQDLQLMEVGAPRVSLPLVAVEFDGSAALTGQIRPQRISVAGAELSMVRSADGRISLMLNAAAPTEPTDLSETLAGIDRMFQHPVFDQIEELRGTNITLTIEDAVSGDRFLINDAELGLVPQNDSLTLDLFGRLHDRPNADVNFQFTRRASAGETTVTARFENIPAQDVAAASEALAWLNLIDAPLSGQMASVFYDDMRVGTLSGALQIGAGQVQPGGTVAPLALEELSLRFAYDAETARLNVDEMVVVAPVFSAVIEGHADLLEGPVYLTQFRLRDITANPPDVFENAIRFDGGALDMRLQIDPVVAVDLGQAVLFDDDMHVQLSGRIAAETTGLSAQLDAEIDQADARRVVDFWPIARVPNTRRWLDQNVQAGTVRNLHAALRVSDGQTPQFAATVDFDAANVRALRAMAPIEEGRGYIDFAGNVFTLALHEGFVTAPNGAPLDLSGSVMRLDDTRIRTPEAHFDLQIAGAVPAVLTLIEAEPLNLLDQFPQDPATVAQGLAELDVALDFTMQRTIAPSDVSFAIDGQLRNVRSTELVEGRTITASRLNLNADNDSLSIGGPARLDGMQADATWSRALGPGATAASEVNGVVTFSPEVLTTFGVGMPPGMVSGSGPAAFRLALSPGVAPALSVSSNLDGVGLSLPELGWSMPRGQTGALTAEIRLGQNPDVTRLDILGAGLVMQSSVSLSSDGQLDRVRFDRFSLSNQLDVTGSLIQENGALQLVIASGNVDLRGLTNGAGGQDGGGGIPIEMSLDRLTVTDGIFLTNLRATLSGRPMTGQFRGLIGGITAVNGGLITNADGPAIRMVAEDGGAVLRGAGLYDNAYGGAMELILRPLPGDGRFRGTMTIANPRLRDAPAIAELLNLISVVGILDQLASGEGVALGDVTVEFQLSPGRVTIQEGTAVGPAMGLSMQGIVDTNTEYFDFEGVVSPFYVVNGLLGGLFSPRREGLFGFTYRLAGTPGNASVTVNPLSVFTPGVFREIFRRPPPEVQ